VRAYARQDDDTGYALHTAAITRARAHVPPPADPAGDDALSRQYPYVTPARARQIREEIEQDRSTR